MSITAERKAALIEEYATKPGDTGSPEVQVAILTERINNLTGHFKDNKKDNHSRRGLLNRLVSTRRFAALINVIDAKGTKRRLRLLSLISPSGTFRLLKRNCIGGLGRNCSCLASDTTSPVSPNEFNPGGRTCSGCLTFAC